MAAKRDTPCTSILLAVKMVTPSTYILMRYRKGYTLHVHTAGGGKGYTLHVHKRLLLHGVTLDIWCWKIIYNTEIPECRKKISPASAFLPVVNCLIPASAFRNQGSVRYRCLRISPSLPSYGRDSPPTWRVTCEVWDHQRQHVEYCGCSTNIQSDLWSLITC